MNEQARIVKLEQQVSHLRALLESACNAIKWYRDACPDEASDADPEFLQEALAAIDGEPESGEQERSELLAYAHQEFAALGWPGDDEMQAAICQDVLTLLAIFAEQGHSGFSAQYATSLFTRLARFEPLGPLTGEDQEWNEVGEGVFQNRRCSAVFKENGEAYWLDGRVFRRPDGAVFTSRDSRVPITFPWRKPDRPEYVDLPFDPHTDSLTAL